MRTAVLPLALVLALAPGACTADDDFDDDLGEDTSELEAPAGMVAFEPLTSSDDFLNPERGFYVGYNLRAASDATPIRTGGYSLAIAVVNLEDYRDRPLDSTLLTSLSNGFARVRAAGVKLVLRFSYNAAFAPDASKARILEHINQLAPLLRDNADVIAVMQAGFIGAWGEWHSSTHGLDNPTDRAEILAALLSALPSSRSVQVRTPMFKAAYRSGAVTASEAYTGTSRSRLGHHNDCFLASASDYGTYASPVDDWKAYVAADTLYTPMGGETCAVNEPRTGCDAALAEMTAHHWSYLNRQYHQTVISNWVTQGCDSAIRRYLGYRFVLRRVAHTVRVAPGGVLDLEIDVRNRGFAAPFNRRPVDVVLTNGTVRHVARLAVDARRFAPGVKTTLARQLRIPATLAPGTYTLAVRLPDAHWRLARDPRHAIRFANVGTWNAETGDNVLTRSFVVDAAAPGERDTAATTFAELP